MCVKLLLSCFILSFYLQTQTCRETVPFCSNSSCSLSNLSASRGLFSKPFSYNKLFHNGLEISRSISLVIIRTSHVCQNHRKTNWHPQWDLVCAIDFLKYFQNQNPFSEKISTNSISLNTSVFRILLLFLGNFIAKNTKIVCVCI